MTGPVEWLVGAVLGVDALVIAGLLVSRLTGRYRRRNGAGSAEEVSRERLMAYAAPDGAGVAVAGPPHGSSDAWTSDATAEPETPQETAYEEFADVPAAVDERVSVDEAVARPEREAALETVEETAPAPEYELEPAVAATDWDAAVAETPAIPERAERPMGLDFGPTWVDPVAMAAEAAAEWRRGLRRDLALAAWRGRPGLVMHLKLDVESGPSPSIADVARFEAQLHQAIGRLVRASDHFDRTGPGRFHLILPEMSEAAAHAVAERIRRGFADTAGMPAPRLLIGWAAMDSEADIALALQRAAERLDGIALADAGAPAPTPAPDPEPSTPAAAPPEEPRHSAPTADPTNGRVAPEATGAADEV